MADSDYHAALLGHFGFSGSVVWHLLVAVQTAWSLSIDGLICCTAGRYFSNLNRDDFSTQAVKRMRDGVVVVVDAA